MNGLIGGMLLCFCGGCLGYGVIAEMRRRVRGVRALREGLYQLERELTLQFTPLPLLLQREYLPFWDCFVRCGQSIGEGASVVQAWDRLVEELPCLGREEMDILRPLGQVLGQYEGEVQGEALLRASEALGRLDERLEGDLGRLGRVYPTVGMTVGTFLAIVLG